ncbi:MAG: hypothetical protein KC425_25055 [Anaerolineales bacterium]|nr:hypothetical protein [Anaerolineales bacterium]MCA9974313.1 hypothetical protein [Anaerolineales bacterium]
MTDPNPVVLLNNDVWHVVEDSRRSAYALCGQRLAHRQAHSRLHTIGREHLCPACARLLDKDKVQD